MLLLTLLPVLLSFIPVQGAFLREEDTSASEQQCRDRTGYYPKTAYNQVTCGACYLYLFGIGRLTDAQLRNLIPQRKGSGLPPYFLVDHTDETIKTRVCGTLDDEDQCQSWVQCCQAAVDCCERQLTMAPSFDKMACPRTWDGYACWDDAKPGLEVSTRCPDFLPHIFPGSKASKKCMDNGTWYSHPATTTEWTNYTSCYRIGSI